MSDRRPKLVAIATPLLSESMARERERAIDKRDKRNNQRRADSGGEQWASKRDPVGSLDWRAAGQSLAEGHNHANPCHVNRATRQTDPHCCGEDS